MPNGLLQLLVLMATDIFVCCATIAATVAAYWEMGADLRPCCYFRLWPLPLIYVAIAAGYGLYRGTWPETKPPWNPVIFLKAQFKAVLLTFLTLFCYLMFTRGNIRYSRVILAVSSFLLIWLLPAGRSIAGRMLHLPAAQLDFNKKLPLHNGLLLPIPRIFKAVAEKIIAAVFLLLLSPLFIVLTILVKLTSRGPAFYVSERIGRNGRKFKILKYRTMVHQSDRKLEQILSESPTIRASRRWAVFSARPAWTNCRNYGTCFAATWRSSARAPSSRRRFPNTEVLMKKSFPSSPASQAYGRFQAATNCPTTNAYASISTTSATGPSGSTTIFFSKRPTKSSPRMGNRLLGF